MAQSQMYIGNARSLAVARCIIIMRCRYTCNYITEPMVHAECAYLCTYRNSLWRVPSGRHTLSVVVIHRWCIVPCTPVMYMHTHGERNCPQTALSLGLSMTITQLGADHACTTISCLLPLDNNCYKPCCTQLHAHTDCNTFDGETSGGLSAGDLVGDEWA